MLVLSISFISCNDDDENVTGTSVLVSSSEVARKTPQVITATYADSDDAVLSLINHGITVHKIVYNTKNEKDEYVRASGIVIIPQVSSTASMPIIAYFHGTVNPSGDEDGKPYYPSAFNYNSSESCKRIFAV